MLWMFWRQFLLPVLHPIVCSPMLQKRICFCYQWCTIPTAAFLFWSQNLLGVTSFSSRGRLWQLIATKRGDKATRGCPKSTLLTPTPALNTPLSLIPSSHTLQSDVSSTSSFLLWGMLQKIPLLALFENCILCWIVYAVWFWVRFTVETRNAVIPLLSIHFPEVTCCEFHLTRSLSARKGQLNLWRANPVLLSGL